MDFVEFNYTQMIGEEWLGMEAGWEEVRNPASGTYYYHRTTGETRWEKPVSAAAMGAAAGTLAAMVL